MREILSLSALLLANIQCAMAADEYMWRVTSSEMAAHVIGVSHAPIPVQFGAYWEGAVLPAFDASSHHYFEAANNSYSTERPRPCPATRPVSPEGLEVIAETRRRARQRLVMDAERQLRASPQLKALVPDYVERVANAAERLAVFDLWVMTAFTNANANNWTAAGMPKQFRFAIVDLLKQRDAKQGESAIQHYDRPNFDEEAAYSLESEMDWHAAFCEVAGDHWRILQDFSRDNDRMRDAMTSGRGKEFFEGKYNAVMDTTDDGLSRFRFASRESAEFLCNRNRRWVNRFKSFAKPGTKPFVSVGAAHLHDIEAEGSRCKGFLTLLREAGYQVTKVSLPQRD